MLVALHFCRKDHAQASRLAEWLDEIGPFPGHHFLIARNRNADPDIFIGRKNHYPDQIVIRDDTSDKWPESANHAFRKIGKHVQHSMGAQAFLLIEPDCVVLRASAFDEIEAEYQTALAAGKLFLGQLIDQRGIGIDSPPHMSGLGVYAADLVQHAGIIYQADNVPFDIIAGPQIVPRLMQSELLLHNWKAPPFESWADVERRIFAVRPKCAIFHSDKSGSLLGLLRERKNFSGDGESRPVQDGAGPGIGSPVALCSSEESGDNAGRNHRHCDISLASGSSAPPAENNLLVPSLADPLAGCESRRESRPDDAALEAGESETKRPTSSEVAERPAIDGHSPGEQSPWASKADSIAEIRKLAERLKQFSVSAPTVRLVRAELHDAGVIVLPYRFPKRKGWKRKRRQSATP